MHLYVIHHITVHPTCDASLAAMALWVARRDHHCRCRKSLPPWPKPALASSPSYAMLSPLPAAWHIAPAATVASPSASSSQTSCAVVCRSSKILELDDFSSRHFRLRTADVPARCTISTRTSTKSAHAQHSDAVPYVY